MLLCIRRSVWRANRNGEAPIPIGSCASATSCAPCPYELVALSSAFPDANFTCERLKRLAHVLERVKFDACLTAPSHTADMPIRALRRSAKPFTLLSALVCATERIRLIATASTRFNEPCHIAPLRLARPHGGWRAGWNIVTNVQSRRNAQFWRARARAHGGQFSFCILPSPSR